jgi:hypothetical protein
MLSKGGEGRRGTRSMEMAIPVRDARAEIRIFKNLDFLIFLHILPVSPNVMNECNLVLAFRLYYSHGHVTSHMHTRDLSTVSVQLV